MGFCILRGVVRCPGGPTCSPSGEVHEATITSGACDGSRDSSDLRQVEKKNLLNAQLGVAVVGAVDCEFDHHHHQGMLFMTMTMMLV
jgi:hypothetical protein